MKGSAKAHFLLTLHLQIVFFIVFFFTDLKSSDPNDADSSDITWGQFCALHTVPSGEKKSFILFFLLHIHSRTPQHLEIHSYMSEDAL